MESSSGPRNPTSRGTVVEDVAAASGARAQKPGKAGASRRRGQAEALPAALTGEVGPSWDELRCECW